MIYGERDMTSTNQTTKAGARHSRADLDLLQAIHDSAIKLGASCGWTNGMDVLKAVSMDQRVDVVREAFYQAFYGSNPDAAWSNGWTLSAVEDGYVIVRRGLSYWRVPYTITDEGMVQFAVETEWEEIEPAWVNRDGTAIKSLGNDRIGGYAVLFGSPDTHDLHQEYFTKNTDFWLDYWEKRPMIYDHGQEPHTAEQPVVGVWHKAIKDDIGVWIEGELDRAHRYYEAIRQLIAKGVLKLSSDSALHLVRRRPAKHGTQEIVRWPLLAVSLTPTPAEPRLHPVSAIKSVGCDAHTHVISDESPQRASISANAARGLEGDAMKSQHEQQEPQRDMTINELIAAAKSAIAAGDLERAEQYQRRAELLRKLESLETTTNGTTATKATQPPGRLPFPDQTNTSMDHEERYPVNAVTKSWFVRRFGTLEDEANQIAKELYGHDYMGLAAAKHADFRRYLRYGVGDPQLARLILMTPQQIVETAALGMGVGEIKAAMIEADDTLGGYLVPEDFRTQIIERLPGLTTVRPLANRVTTSRDRVSFPIAMGGDSRYASAVRVYWVDEQPASGAASETGTSWGLVTIPVHVVMANIPVSRNMLEDAAFDIADYLQRQFAVAMAIDEDRQFLLGSGVGRPQGILPGGNPLSTIAVINSGNANTITADRIVAMPFRIDAQYRQAQTCRWVFNKSTLETIAQLKDSANRYLFSHHDESIGQGPSERLRGFAYSENEEMPSIAANAHPILFGDFAGYTIVDRIGMSIERYLDSNTAARNQVHYYARRRLGGQVTEPWRFVVMKIAA